MGGIVQFHLDGFKLGDPHVAAPARSGRDDIDVLIVGCGPAGLTLAAQLAAFPDVNTRIVDQKPGPLQLGQADGVACRTMEMFEAFGFAERVLKEAYWVNETVFWKPDPARPASIARSGRIQDTEDGLSEFPHVILNQARVHDFYLDVMRRAPTRLEPHYARRLTGLTMPAHPDEPVSATFERLDAGHEGEVETVRARYVVGCDGARSAVRKSLGLALQGDSANHAWGVMDVLAVTDFPDIRFKSVIQSAHEGSLLIIPREGGFLVRMYIELEKLNPSERVAGRNIDTAHLIAAAQRILHPYTLEVKEIAWWSVYEIGQRLCDRFDDASTGAPPRVFIAGDACHTHSPKAGQGMNVSMQDGFNLGWKLAAVVRGQCPPGLLATYSAERQAVAAELIAFDREFAAMFGTVAKAEGSSVNAASFQSYFVRQGRYTAGTETKYQSSMIVGPTTRQHLAAGLTIGMRFHSAPVIRLADAKPMQLGATVKADGRWRLFVFAATDLAPLQALCAFLEASPASPVRRYTPAGADIDAVIDVRGILPHPHQEIALNEMPPLLRPAKGRYGLRDYEKLFCPDLKSGQDIFARRGIDRTAGCVVVVRPDQYVAHVLPLAAHDQLAAFFAPVFLDRHRMEPAAEAALAAPVG